MGRKKDEDEDENNEDSDKEKIKRRGIFRIASVILAIVSIVIFTLTENMKYRMTLVDKWTILMIVLFVVQILLALFSKKKKTENDDENEREF